MSLWTAGTGMYHARGIPRPNAKLLTYNQKTIKICITTWNVSGAKRRKNNKNNTLNTSINLDYEQLRRTNKNKNLDIINRLILMKSPLTTDKKVLIQTHALSSGTSKRFTCHPAQLETVPMHLTSSRAWETMNIIENPNKGSPMDNLHTSK